jgi:hypothetical protein
MSDLSLISKLDGQFNYERWPDLPVAAQRPGTAGKPPTAEDYREYRE